MNHFPKNSPKIGVPPIKCQGIKTKLIPFIAENIHWDNSLTKFIMCKSFIFN
jgi:DNA adenine methylase